MIIDAERNCGPPVSFAKPDGLLDGHPQSSKLGLFEAYLKNILDTLDDNPKLKAHTAVFVIFDETGGYYDSGFIQPLDFFGDGPRIPLIVISPFSRGGKVSHTYGDHVSVLKFIERNWDLPPLTGRSRWSPCGRRARRRVCYRPSWLTSDLVMNASAHSAALASTEANPRGEAKVSLLDRQSLCLADTMNHKGQADEEQIDASAIGH